MDLLQRIEIKFKEMENKIKIFLEETVESIGFYSPKKIYFKSAFLVNDPVKLFKLKQYIY